MCRRSSFKLLCVSLKRKTVKNMMKQKLSTVPITLFARQFSLFVRQAANCTPSSPSYSYQRFESAAGTDRRKNASTTTTRPYSILRNFKRVLLAKSNAPPRTYCIAAPTMPTATQACWSCSADLQAISLGGLFCHSCGALRNTNKATVFICNSKIISSYKMSRFVRIGLF